MELFQKIFVDVFLLFAVAVFFFFFNQWILATFISFERNENKNKFLIEKQNRKLLTGKNCEQKKNRKEFCFKIINMQIYVLKNNKSIDFWCKLFYLFYYKLTSFYVKSWRSWMFVFSSFTSLLSLSLSSTLFHKISI